MEMPCKTADSDDHKQNGEKNALAIQAISLFQKEQQQNARQHKEQIANSIYRLEKCAESRLLAIYRIFHYFSLLSTEHIWQYTCFVRNNEQLLLRICLLKKNIFDFPAIGNKTDNQR